MADCHEWNDPNANMEKSFHTIAMSCKAIFKFYFKEMTRRDLRWEMMK
jgi:hypothetical protein